MKSNLFIFDADETLVRGPKGRPPTTRQEQTLIDGVLQICIQLRKGGHTLAIASNQGGVPFGYGSRETVHERISDLARVIGALHYAVCLTHPSGTVPEITRESVFRKPEPGMLAYLIDACGYSPADAVFVGDAQTDMQAAAAAKIRFHWAEDFFGSAWEQYTTPQELPPSEAHVL